MKRVLFYLLLVAVLPVGCTKESAATKPVETVLPIVDTTATTYIIQKGNHYCDQTHFQPLTKAAIAATVTFNSSATYVSALAENQRDVNKLIGFSDCGTDHQENSARLGWSWTGGKLVIYAYAYHDKQRITKTLGTAELDKPFSCSVRAEKGHYYFTLNQVRDSIPRYCSEYSGTHYKLFPYFGGDEVAPHNIDLIIKETP